MSTNTKEAALDACIQRHLTGGVSVKPSPGGPMSDDVGVYQTSKGAGYLRGKSTDFNTEFAIDEAKFWQFLEATQATELAKLHYKADWMRQVLERLHRKLKKDGILAVLKKGLDVVNAHFTLLYRLPYNDLNPDVTANVQFHGIGLRYLIQHSAGSGKSHSTTWLGYQLVELYDKTGQQNLFDSVIVVTDRRVLDRQIDKNIRQFAEVKNNLAHANSAAELRA